VSRPPEQPCPRLDGDYIRQFWLKSLEASWRGQELEGSWDAARLDWRSLWAAAQIHRVAAGLGRLWERMAGLPDAVGQEVWLAREFAERRGRAVREGLADLSSVARERAVRPVLMKSLSYLLDAFTGFRDREVQDIDVLATAADARMLAAGMTARGYAVSGLRRQLVLVKGLVDIELHQEASNRRRFWRLLPTAELLARSQPDPHWPPLGRLATGDEAIVLVLHAYHHCHRQALWIRDLAAWWRVRDPSPEEILADFLRLNIRRIGWVAWCGMERIGWRRPQAWTPEKWDADAAFDRLVADYWDHRLLDFGSARDTLMLGRRLEWAQARGIGDKLRVCLPWFSLGAMRELRQMRPRPRIRTEAAGSGSIGGRAPKEA
jgi:hypothetical protein